MKVSNSADGVMARDDIIFNAGVGVGKLCGGVVVGVHRFAARKQPIRQQFYN